MSATNAWWQRFISLVAAYVAALGGKDLVTVHDFRLAARAAFTCVNSTQATKAGCPDGVEPNSQKTLRRLTHALGLNLQSAWRRAGICERVPQCARDIVLPESASRRNIPGVSRTLQELYQFIFVLDLGTGTSPWTDYVNLGALGEVWIFVTVDNEPKRRATFTRDVTRWPEWIDDVLQYMRETYGEHFHGFHWVHWSPECTKIAASNTRGDKDEDGAVMLALAGLALVAHIAPIMWTMESSSSGKVCLEKQKPIMEAFEQFRVDEKVHFCQSLGLGNWKPGRWWTNVDQSFLFPLSVLKCVGWAKCPHCTTFGGHKFTSQGGRSVTGALGMKRDDVMRFPPGLVHAWLRVSCTFLKARALCV